MRDVNQVFRSLPGRAALHHRHAVLCHDVHSVRAGICDDTAVRQSRSDSAYEIALLVCESGGHADKGLAALRSICADDEIKLSARAGDVLCSRALSVDLSEQITVNRVVNGNEVIQRADLLHVVDIVNGSAHALGVSIQIVVHLLRARAESIGLQASVDVLVRAGDLAGFRHIYESVYIHLCVDAQVLQVRLCDHLADRVGHSSDAELQACTVGDPVHDQLGDGFVHFRAGLCRRHRVDRSVVAFDDHIDIADMNICASVTEADRHARIDFHDHLLRHLYHCIGVAGAGTEVEIAVSVHGADLHDRHVQRILPVQIIAGKLRILERSVEAEPCGGRLSLHAVHVPAVPDEVLLGILYFENLRRVHQDTAVDLHIVHLGHSLGEFSVHRDVRCGAPAVIDPVAVLNHCRSLRGCHQFLLIFFRVTHISSSDLDLTLTALFRHRFYSTSAPKYRIVVLYNNCLFNSSKNSIDSSD